MPNQMMTVKSHGRYGLKDFPHTGWWINEESERLIPIRCQACRQQYVSRRVFRIEHADHGEIEVGRDCCDYLTGQGTRAAEQSGDRSNVLRVHRHQLIDGRDIDPLEALLAVVTRKYVEVM